MHKRNLKTKKEIINKSEKFKSNPAGLTKLINRFLTSMTNIIIHNGGTIDKFMGDCIMAFWNAPLDNDKHRQLAIKSAIESGRGISILPKETFAKEVALGSLLAIPFDKKMSQPVSFIYKEQKFPLKIVNELLNYVKEISDMDYLPHSSNTVLES